jgi:hypothetical protein
MEECMTMLRLWYEATNVNGLPNDTGTGDPASCILNPMGETGLVGFPGAGEMCPAGLVNYSAHGELSTTLHTVGLGECEAPSHLLLLRLMRRMTATLIPLVEIAIPQMEQTCFPGGTRDGLEVGPSH